MIIGYTMVGTNDLKRAGEFYDALLAELGAKRMMGSDTFIAWSNDPKGTAFCVTKPHDEADATVGNGVMIALSAGTKEKVDALYAKAIELGATCEGKPGPRGTGFYGGYFRDPDGNKLNAFCMGV